MFVRCDQANEGYWWCTTSWGWCGFEAIAGAPIGSDAAFRGEDDELNRQKSWGGVCRGGGGDRL
eukprot:3770139-Prymnesium_polylepis.1